MLCDFHRAFFMGELLSALVLLAFSAFTSATILPGSSEVVLAIFIESFPQHIWLAFLVATLTNSLGSMTSLVLGRVIPPKKLPSLRVQQFIRRYGSLSLLLSWVPIIGDALPLAAGWLRLKFFPCVICLFIGKAARYWILLLLWQNVW